MNATELQTRIKSLAYKLVVLCDRFPSSKTVQILDGNARACTSSRTNNTIESSIQQRNFVGAKMTTTLLETGSALFCISSVAHLQLIEPTKLLSIIKEADALTRVLAAPSILSTNKPEHK